jgi:transcriptional regulator with GAF, ATPase, and Fis domain
MNGNQPQFRIATGLAHGVCVIDSSRRFHDGPSGPLADADVAERLDRLAGELSSTLIQLSAEAIDATFRDTLRRIVETLNVDRATFHEFDEEAATVETLHTWARPGIEQFSAERDLPQVPLVMQSLIAGQTLVFPSVNHLPPEAVREREYARRSGIKACLMIPVAVAGRRICGLTVGSFRAERAWPPQIVEHVRFVAEILAAALHRRRQERALASSREEVARLNRQLEAENVYLKEEIRDLHGFDEIIGDSPALRDALAQVQEVAPTNSTVLLLGDTGTGKELFARAIHDRSPRRQRPIIRVNCAALPPTLIESELFGHERGAFTGALTMRQGRFELADRGTLFLDEIGDLPMELQAKLLRVLQEGEFERLGSSYTRKIDVRVIAATHRDLEAAVDEGRFRSDLFYRLSVFPIRLPGLRDRLEDIPRLVWFFVHQKQRRLHRHVTKVPGRVMDALQRYQWPGNVRELENVIERALIRSTGDTLVLDEGLGRRHSAAAVAGDNSLEGVERRHMLEVLRKCGWRINGSGNAAEQLGLHPNTLRFRMKKLGIAREVPPAGRSAVE